MMIKKTYYFMAGDPKCLRLAILLLLLTITHTVIAKDNTVLSRLDSQEAIYPQEKIHVVTNRDIYCAGDTIWLRTFVVDAATLDNAGLSKYAYVELRDPFKKVVSRIKLIDRDGVFAGYMPLPEDLPEGNYTLSAYTFFSENQGKDYFFRKPIKILAPYASKYIIESQFIPTGEGEVKGNFKLRAINGDKLNYNVMSWTMPDGKTLEFTDSPKGFSKKFKRNKDEDVVLVKFGDYAKFIAIDYPTESIDIRFYPEGGWLIAGVPCEVAFKATDEYGNGVFVSGIVRDESGDEISTFSTTHNGMGRVGFVPEQGKNYTAEYIGPDGKMHTAEIGSPKPGAASLHYGVSRARSVFSVAGGKGMDLVLVIALRGKGVLATPLSADQPIAINKEELPTGLYQALLVSREDSTVVSERLFFIGADRPMSPQTEISSDSLAITLKSPVGGKADCSIRIALHDKVSTNKSPDVRTQLLLQSELRGRIEDPAYYFDTNEREAERNLDLLMMVNGWSRYNIPDVILGKYIEPTYPLEIGQEISGQVRSRWSGKPMEGVRVYAIAPKADFGTYADTDESGHFYLNGFDFPEGTSFIFRAMNEKGGNEGNYEINQTSYPDSDILALNDKDSAPDIDILQFFRGSRWTLLDEIKVQAFSKETADIFETLAANSKTTDDFNKKGITTLEEAVRDIAGVIIRDGRLYWRNAPVKYYIDGIRHDPISEKNSFHVSSTRREKQKQWDGIGKAGRVMPEPSPNPDFNNVPTLSDVTKLIPFDAIKRIDFIRSGEALILGNDLPGGALMITTKSGDEIAISKQFELKDYIPLGYQKYKEFSSPLLSSEADPYDLQTNTTLLWLPAVRFDESGTEIKLTHTVPSNCDIIIEGISNKGPIYEKY